MKVEGVATDWTPLPRAVIYRPCCLLTMALVTINYIGFLRTHCEVAPLERKIMVGTSRIEHTGAEEARRGGSVEVGSLATTMVSRQGTYLSPDESLLPQGDM